MHVSLPISAQIRVEGPCENSVQRGALEAKLSSGSSAIAREASAARRPELSEAPRRRRRAGEPRGDCDRRARVQAACRAHAAGLEDAQVWNILSRQCRVSRLSRGVMSCY